MKDEINGNDLLMGFDPVTVIFIGCCHKGFFRIVAVMWDDMVLLEKMGVSWRRSRERTLVWELTMEIRQ